MFVNYGEPRKFTLAEIEEAEFLAGQAAMVCRHTQMFDASTTLLAQQRSVLHLARQLLVTETLEDSLALCLDVTVSYLDVEFANIVLLRNNQFVFAKGPVSPEAFSKLQIVEAAARSHAVFTINENVAVPVDDFATEVRFLVPDDSRNIASGLGVPMRFGADVLGALLVHTRQTRHFTEMEAEFLTAVADQAAVAVFRGSLRGTGAF
jgi:GAF domain-containing protein